MFDHGTFLEAGANTLEDPCVSFHDFFCWQMGMRVVKLASLNLIVDIHYTLYIIHIHIHIYIYIYTYLQQFFGLI